jgi:hypothetical protein
VVDVELVAAAQEIGPEIEALWAKNYSVYGRRKLAKAARKAGSTWAVTRSPG